MNILNPLGNKERSLSTMPGITYIGAIISAVIQPHSTRCPPIKPLSDLNISEYARSTWYIQKQQITGYQPADSLYCVSQTLNEENKTVPFFSGPVLSVYNYANSGGVNGPPDNAKNGTVLCARIPDEQNTGSIINAPCFLPNFLAGPYWVIAAGPTSKNYEWAIVSGGPPTQPTPDGNCTTKTTGVNGSGLWLFTRCPGDGKGFVPKMETILREKGYSTSLLLPVKQDGCNYKGAFIKH